MSNSPKFIRPTIAFPYYQAMTLAFWWSTGHTREARVRNYDLRPDEQRSCRLEWSLMGGVEVE